MRQIFAASALAAALTVAIAAPATAAVITPVSAVASDTFDLFGIYRAENLIDGSGLTGQLHNDNFAAMWQTNLGVNQASILFDLGIVSNLSGATIWNYNFGNPAQFQSTILRGVKDFTLSGSVDGVGFTEIFAGRLAVGTGQPLAGETFALTGTARFVRLDILNNYGQGTFAERDWNSGLSEVRFAGSVPEPTSWAMLLTGFAFTGAALRRRKARAAA